MMLPHTIKTGESLCWDDLWWPSSEVIDVRIGVARNLEDQGIHSHSDFFELVIVTRGTAVNIHQNQSFNIGKGSCFVIHPNQSHGFFHTRNLDVYNVCIKESALKQQPLALLSSRGFLALFKVEPMFRVKKGLESQLNMSGGKIEEIAWLLQHLMAILVAPDPLSQVRTKALFTELLARLAFEYQSISTDTFKPASLQFAKAVSYIESNYAEAITVVGVAKYAGMAVRSLHRSCWEYAGVSPKRLIMDIRIEKAKELLQKRGNSITDVAFSTGFTDSSHFSKCFKMIVGSSPKEYRNTFEAPAA